LTDLILKLSPICERLGRGLADLAPKLADRPTLNPPRIPPNQSLPMISNNNNRDHQVVVEQEQDIISLWPFNMLGHSILPFSLYRIKPSLPMSNDNQNGPRSLSNRESSRDRIERMELIRQRELDSQYLELMKAPENDTSDEVRHNRNVQLRIHAIVTPFGGGSNGSSSATQTTAATSSS